VAVYFWFFLLLQVVEVSVGSGALPSSATEALDELYAGYVFGVGSAGPVAIVPGITPAAGGSPRGLT
jgi:hypothetical protein